MTRTKPTPRASSSKQRAFSYLKRKRDDVDFEKENKSAMAPRKKMSSSTHQQQQDDILKPLQQHTTFPLTKQDGPLASTSESDASSQEMATTSAARALAPHLQKMSEKKQYGDESLQTGFSKSTAHVDEHTNEQTDILRDASTIAKSVTSKDEIQKLAVHQEKMRDFVIQEISRQLGGRSQWENVSQAVLLAIQIEEALFQHYSHDSRSKQYKEQFQNIRFNLRDQGNEDFWRRVWHQKVTPEQLASMSSLDMAAESKKQEREEISQASLIQCIKKNASNVAFIVCPKCHHKNLRVEHESEESLSKELIDGEIPPEERKAALVEVRCVSCGELLEQQPNE